jgi:hypothetical protein
VCVSRLCASLQDSVQFQTWVLVDIDVWIFTFLSNGEMLSIGVHSDRSDAIPILTVEGDLLLSLQVVSLVLVSSDIDDLI